MRQKNILLIVGISAISLLALAWQVQGNARELGGARGERNGARAMDPGASRPSALDLPAARRALDAEVASLSRSEPALGQLASATQMLDPVGIVALQLESLLDQSMAGVLDYEALLGLTAELLELEASQQVYLGTDVGDGIRFPLLGTPERFDAFVLLRDDIKQLALEVKIDPTLEEPLIVEGVARDSKRLLFGGRFDAEGTMTHCEMLIQMPPSGIHNRALGINLNELVRLKHGMSFSFAMADPFATRAREWGTDRGASYKESSNLVATPHPSVLMASIRRIGVQLTERGLQIRRR